MSAGVIVGLSPADFYLLDDHPHCFCAAVRIAAIEIAIRFGRAQIVGSKICSVTLIRTTAFATWCGSLTLSDKVLLIDDARCTGAALTA